MGSASPLQAASKPEPLAPPIATSQSPTAALRTQESDHNTTGSGMNESAELAEGEGAAGAVSAGGFCQPGNAAD